MPVYHALLLAKSLLLYVQKAKAVLDEERYKMPLQHWKSVCSAHSLLLWGNLPTVKKVDLCL